MDTSSIISLQTIHTNYVRNSRAIAVLWCVFTICFAIINIIVFMQPWLASTGKNSREGYLGLYESCYYDIQTYEIISSSKPTIRTDKNLICDGVWSDFSSTVNAVATFFIGFSALNNLICIATFLVLFLFINPAVLLVICGVLQIVSSKLLFFLIPYYIGEFKFEKTPVLYKAVCMMLGCVLYPFNWNSERVRSICETSSAYNPGNCEIKWAYILSIIGVFDILCLAVLAFVLAARQAPSLELTDTILTNHAYINKNASFDDLSRFNSINRSQSRQSVNQMKL
jgi:hypothetical protein